MNTAVQIIGTTATVGAVVLALWLQVFRERARRPALEVLLDTRPDKDDDIVIFEGEDYIEYYLRVKIRAKPKKNSAKSVQVLLLRVERPNERKPSTLRVPDALFKWSGPSYAESVDIAPGTWRRLDVLRYRKETDKEPILAPVLNRPGNTTDWPPSPRSRLGEPPGEYQIDFVVSCDGAEPTFWCLRFEFQPGTSTAREPQHLIGHFANIRLEKVSEPGA